MPNHVRRNTSNNLNQYDPVVTATTPQTGQRLKYDLDGNLTEAFVTGDINGDGNVDMSDLGALLAAYGTCEGQQGYNPNANISPNNPGPQCVDMADLGVLLSVYGLQATGAIRAKFTWDAENRLVGWEPLLFVSGAKKVEFKYDYIGRRIEKKVYTYNGSSWSLSETRRFIWNNWLLLLELEDDGDVLRKLTWGRDLSGSLDGAGGIGGLLAIQDTNGTTTGQDPESDDLRYVYFYDANGNVGQVIDLAASSASASIKAHYEYDAYGKVLVQSGSYATANPYRFSTKPWDDETGLGYWGQRYYDPRLGRWTNHDPIGERGGKNLYAYAFNGPTAAVDPLGRLSLAGPSIWNPCPQQGPSTGPTTTPATQCSQPSTAPTPPEPDPCLCPPGFAINCKTGECEKKTRLDIYGHCCGPYRDCAPTGCASPIPGDCVDAACDAHDNCYYSAGVLQFPDDPGQEPTPYNEKQATCDCNFVCQVQSCGADPATEQGAAAQWIKLAYCQLIQSNGFDCGCCDPPPKWSWPRR